jgi:hypothetical protein
MTATLISKCRRRDSSVEVSAAVPPCPRVLDPAPESVSGEVTADMPAMNQRALRQR